MKGILKNVKIFGKRYSVCDHKAYVYYRDNSKFRNKENTPHFVEYGKIISEIYRKVSEDITEYTHGVYAKNYFYCIPNAYPQKTMFKTGTKEGLKTTMNAHTKGKAYTILFVNLFSNKSYWMWQMDYSFFGKIKKRLVYLLKNERPEYKFSLDTLLKNK